MNTTPQTAMRQGPVTTPGAFAADQHNFLLQVFLNNTDSSVIITDVDFRIIFFNKLANKWASGFVQKPLYHGMPLQELANAESKASQLQYLEAALAGQHFESEYRIALAGNDFVCFSNSYMAARNDEGEIVGVLITSKDITERKKKEEQLRLTNERFNLIIKATSDAVWDYDVVRNDIFFNDSFIKYFGHDPSAWDNGYDLWERHIHPEDRDRVITKINASINSLDTYWEDEYRFLTNDGNIAYVYDRGTILRNDTGVAIRMTGSMQDITRQKQNELTIALSEHRFRSLVQSGTDLIGVVDEKGCYTYVSPTVAHLGYTPGFMVGKNGFDFIHPDDKDKIVQYLEAAITQNQVSTPPFRFRHANNEWRWLESVLTNRLHDTAINGVVINARDITERKRKDEALQKALYELNKIMDSSVDVIVVTDKDNRYVQVSAAATAVWGYKPEELIGAVCIDLVHPDDRQLTEEMTARVMKGKRITNFQNRYIRKDGTIVPLIWSARWDKQEGVMYAIARDASEKVEAEEALKRSEKNYRDLFLNNPLPMFAFDLETWKFVMVNEAAVDFYGYAKKELMQMTIMAIRPEEEQKKLAEFLAKVPGRKNIDRLYSWKHLKKDGSIVEVDTYGHNITIGGRECRLSVVYDVTELNRAKAELQKSEAMFRTISESFPNGIVAILDRALRFEYIAGKELENVGVTASHFVGTSFDQHFPGGGELVNSGANSVFSGQTVVDEVKFLGRNYLVSSVPLYEPDGSIQRILAVAQNITTQKEVQKEKELLIEELTKNIHDLRQFSYITSHNLRAPISNLIGIMNLIDLETISDKNTAFLVEKFKESTIILNETVNDLLSILLIKNHVNVRRELFSLEQVWQDVCTSVDSQLHKAEALVTADFSSGAEVQFNKSYAESILLNLLTNSIKYRSAERQLVVKLTTSLQEDYLVLRFEDNGIGINLEHHRDKIFGLYQRFHNYPDSKGLGLYIVHSQVTALGGKIEVESEVDKGTCFMIYFKR